jgi:hypothetical protein
MRPPIADVKKTLYENEFRDELALEKKFRMVS